MIIRKLFGSRNERILKKIRKIVLKINALECNIEKLSEESLKRKTLEFKERITKGETLDQILPEAFAVVRETSKRVIGMRHYDVQMIGGIVLHFGKIAEMSTGEGKTLVATLPVYLHALTGKGVHVITVNDYLASRDASNMGRIYHFLGISTGVILTNSCTEERRNAYSCDITYGTNNEFGFDYLRDNMTFSKEEQVQRSKNFVVIDEVDSILIDEARTPLIISGALEESSEMYLLFNRLVPSLVEQQELDPHIIGDYYLDEKNKQAYLTETGHKKIELILIEKGILDKKDNLYSPQHINKIHYLNACLRAHRLYQKNIDYIVKNKEIIIIDENTGRAMAGRRWSDGLHQAIEAKEGVKISGENQTLASITFQNFFKLYQKISGMTGTADTEASEFQEIYGLEVVVVPTNRPSQRYDHHDRIFAHQEDKLMAIIKDIKERILRGQPVLVGTVSIETSEILSKLLFRNKVKHNVLNAKKHAKEAVIISQAGYPGNVTIATNMAGRGTDIILGGNWEAEISCIKNPTKIQIERIRAAWKVRNKKVIEAGGLCILGSERHDSRRIDNQLRGRAGRQGNPGESRFYLSMDDNLIRIFASASLTKRMKVALSGGESIEFGMMTKFIAKAQSKVEQYHFNIRKNLLDYDNVTNEQRLAIYKQRDSLLVNDDLSNMINSIRYDVIDKIFCEHISIDTIKENWKLQELEQFLLKKFYISVELAHIVQENKESDNEFLKKVILSMIVEKFQENMDCLDIKMLRQLEKIILIKALDVNWCEHLNAMEYLRDSVNLRGYAQKDPKNEYKKDSFKLFSDMLNNFKYEVICNLAKVKMSILKNKDSARDESMISSKILESYGITRIKKISSDHNVVNKQHIKSKQIFSTGRAKKIKRNDLCPCNSGKKYKQCHAPYYK